MAWQRGGRFWEDVVSGLGYVIAIMLLFTIAAAIQGYDLQAVLFAAILIGAATAYPFAKRQELGWIVDGRGERQKVERVNRGEPIFSQTTHRQRLEQEAVLKDERRTAMFREFSVSLGVAAVGLGLYLTRPFNYAWVAAVACGLVAIPPFARGVKLLGTELLYQSGFQDMPGAKVLDSPVTHPGLETVASQKAHGDARPATEDEALAALKGQSSKPL